MRHESGRDPRRRAMKQQLGMIDGRPLNGRLYDRKGSPKLLHSRSEVEMRITSKGVGGASRPVKERGVLVGGKYDLWRR